MGQENTFVSIPKEKTEFLLPIFEIFEFEIFQ